MALDRRRWLGERVAADADLKAAVEALRVSILAAAPARADTAEPSLRRFALAALDQARIAEGAVARWRSTAADLIAVVVFSIAGQVKNSTTCCT